MANSSRRPLPIPPTDLPHAEREPQLAEMYSASPSYFASPFSYPFVSRTPGGGAYEQSAVLPGGALLHKGFYDLLSIIPSTPSPSRLWRGTGNSKDLLAGPRYEQLGPGNSPRAKPLPQAVPFPAPPPSSPLNAANAAIARKGRRVSKDMVSKPTGFVYVFQQSDNRV